MWNWVKDSELYEKFCSLSFFEKIILFLWAFLPFMWSKIGSDKLSNTYIKWAKIFEVFGVTFESLYSVLFLFAIILFLCRADFVRTALKPPICDFKVLLHGYGLAFISVLAVFGVLSLYFFYLKPEIFAEMQNLSQGAKVPDWIFKSFKEEFTDRLIFYYAMISIFGRSGGGVLSLIFFALSHNYSNAYILSMMFAGYFYLFLMLWSGSLALPILFHILGNGAVFLWFVLMS